MGKFVLKNMAIILIFNCYILAKLHPPVPSISDTTFENKLTVTVTVQDSSAWIYYTTDGTEPMLGGLFIPKKWKFEFDSTVTLKMIAVKKLSNLNNEYSYEKSDISTVTYTKKLSIPFIYPSVLNFPDTISIKLYHYEKDVTIHYTTDGTDPNTNSAIFNKELILRNTTRLKFLAVKNKRVNSEIVTKNIVKIN